MTHNVGRLKINLLVGNDTPMLCQQVRGKNWWYHSTRCCIYLWFVGSLILGVTQSYCEHGFRPDYPEMSHLARRLNCFWVPKSLKWHKTFSSIFLSNSSRFHPSGFCFLAAICSKLKYWVSHQHRNGFYDKWLVFLLIPTSRGSYEKPFHEKMYSINGLIQQKNLTKKYSAVS
jgi:hypothetical protein